MQSALPEETLPSGDRGPSDRLDSWKEIAAYFRRDVRTVRRWEQSLGLPVRRHRQQRGVGVYAYRCEVDEWWKQRDAAVAEAPARSPQGRWRIAPIGWVVVALLATLGLLHSDVWRATAPVERPDSGTSPVSPNAYPGTEEYPSLSPDAQQLAFAWNGGERRNFDIYIRALDSSHGDPVRLTNDPAADLNPTWSPDGSAIAFVRKTAPSQFKVMVISATSAEERSIAICQAAWDRQAGSYLAWTPDGRGLLVLQRESHGQTAGLLLLSPKKGRARRLVLPLDGSSRLPGNEHAIGPAPCFSAG